VNLFAQPPLRADAPREQHRPCVRTLAVTACAPIGQCIIISMLLETTGAVIGGAPAANAVAQCNAVVTGGVTGGAIGGAPAADAVTECNAGWRYASCKRSEKMQCRASPHQLAPGYRAAAPAVIGRAAQALGEDRGLRQVSYLYVRLSEQSRPASELHQLAHRGASRCRPGDRAAAPGLRNRPEGNRLRRPWSEASAAADRSGLDPVPGVSGPRRRPLRAVEAIADSFSQNLARAGPRRLRSGGS
jgi:hypothetical protein